MFNRFIVLATALLSFLVIQPVWAQEVKYEKFKLANGMTVILHEDHALPVCGVNLWYRVGAKDELPGRSGFAHLYEHLMFMGTKRVPGNDFDVIMETGGGANNASTTLDRTNYFSSGPAKLLPTLLWLDADRLEDMGRTMSQEKLDKQRDVVRNEIRQQVENSPYGKAGEATYRLMYPPGHPYHNAVYGTHEDLEAATVGNVTDFFATYYVPRNVSLVVAGDFKSDEIKPLIISLFGSLPGGVEPAHKSADPVKLDRVIRDVTIDDVQLPKMVYVYHSPANLADGDAEMDLLAAVLTQGKTSRLYKRLVFDDKVAVDVAAYQNSAQLGSMFHIEVTAPADADLDVIEKAVDQEIDRLVREGVKPQELEQRKAAVELGKLSQLQAIESKADQLNAYEFYFGEPNSFKRDLDRYRHATPQSVVAWAGKVLTPNARLIQRILPKDAPREATPRDARPKDSLGAAFEPQKPVSFTLTNGIQVQFWQRDELPLTSMQIILKPAAPLMLPESAGLSLLTCNMLHEGTRELDSLAFSDAMDLLGANFGVGSDHESIGVSLTVLRRNFERAVSLAADAVIAPRLDQSDWDRVKRLHLEDLKQSDDEPTVVAARVGMRTLYGEKNPYGWPLSGTIDTASMLTLSAVNEAHRTLFTPSNAVILLAGNLTPADAKAILEKSFGAWKAAPAAPSSTTPDLSMMPKADAMRVVIVDRPEAVQTLIRYAMPGACFADERRARLRLLNTIFGGSFTSRLNQNLRERHGFTYGAGSRFAMQKTVGSVTASASVKADKTGAALKEFVAEFTRIRSGDITPEELLKAQETVRTDVIQSFQGLGGLVGSFAPLVVNGMPLSTLADDLRSLQAVSAPDLNAITRDAFPVEHGVLILVGDKKLILEQIKDMGLPTPIEVDVYGVPVKPGN